MNVSWVKFTQGLATFTQGHWKWYHSKARVQLPIHIL